MGDLYIDIRQLKCNTMFKHVKAVDWSSDGKGEKSKVEARILCDSA